MTQTLHVEPAKAQSGGQTCSTSRERLVLKARPLGDIKRVKARDTSGHDGVSAMGDYLTKSMMLLSAMLFVAGCQQADTDRVRLGVEGVSQSVVYGNDNRREVYSYAGNTFARASQSLVALIPPHLILTQPGGGYAPSPETAQELLQLCADEPFVDQPAVASCSGVLIADDLVLTAGHCFGKEDRCDTYAYVFDYQYSRPSQSSAISDLDVYGCEQLLVHEHRTLPNGKIHDFAVVQLDRKVDLRRRPAPLRTDKVATRESITVMGSPQGLPNKIDTGGSVHPSPSSAIDFWYADTDTFGGSSGSPAYDAALQLVGILIRGNADYVADPELACLRAKRFEGEDEELKGRYEQFATLTPALNAMCATSEGREYELCDPPQPFQGKVSLACSLDHGERTPQSSLWVCLVPCVVLLGRRALGRRSRR